MATYYGVNATKRRASPADLEGAGEKKAPLLVAFDQYTKTAANVQNDVIKFMKLPAGARVMDVLLSVSASLDAAAGTLDLGWEANSVDAADADGFFAVADVTAAASFSMLDDQGTRPGLFKQFSPLGGETQVSATAPHAGGLDATAGTISVAVYYTIS